MVVDSAVSHAFALHIVIVCITSQEVWWGLVSASLMLAFTFGVSGVKKVRLHAKPQDSDADGQARTVLSTRPCFGKHSMENFIQFCTTKGISLEGEVCAHATVYSQPRRARQVL
jgi:hypothetical protein